MKAAVCYEFGKPLVIEELSLRPPRSDEVKVRVAATAICHSDIHDMHSTSSSPAGIHWTASTKRWSPRRQARLSAT